MNGTQIEQLRDLIEHTLHELGLTGSPWVCTVDGATPRRMPRVGEGGAPSGVRVVWHKSRELLEFFDEAGKLLQTVGPGADSRLAASLAS